MSRLRSAASGVRTAIRAVVSTPQRVLTALAANGLALRVVPDALSPAVGRLLDLAADSAVAPVLTTTVFVLGGYSRVLVTLLDWLLLAYLIYRLFPRLLPSGEPAGPLVAQRRFRLLTTALVCVFAIPIADFAPALFRSPILPDTVEPFLPGGRHFLAVFVGWVLVATALLSGSVYSWWRDASITDRLLLMDQLRPGSPTLDEHAEIHARLQRDDWVGPVSNAVGIVSSVLVVEVVCLFFALVAGLAGVLFPLPQFVVLTGIAAGAVGERLPRRAPGPGRLTALRERSVDIETRLYTLLQYVATSRKGLLVAPFYVLGVLLSIVLTLVSFVAIAVLAVVAVTRPDVFLSARVSLLVRWNVVGYLLCGVVPGLYSLWFWVRESYRLPHYLQDWERRRPGTASLADEALPALVARPPWLLLVPSLPVVLFGAFVRLSAFETIPLVLNAGFAIAWPVALVATLWSVRWTIRADPQPAWTESYVLPGAFVLQVIWVWFLFRALDQPQFTGGGLAAVAVTAIIMFYVPDLWVRVDAAFEGGAVRVLVGGGVSAAVATLCGLPLTWTGVVGARLALGGAGVIVLVTVVGSALIWLARRSRDQER